MTRKSALSRRAFLRGSGGIIVGLPFLEAMIPTFARAQAAQPKRFIVAFNGSMCGAVSFAVPSSTGPLGSIAGLESWKSLDSLRQHITIISGMSIPVWNTSLGQSPIPGGSHSGQHSFTRGPILSGMCSHDKMTVHQAGKTSLIAGNQTCDQYAADALSAGTRFRSLELKVQAAPYNGNPTSNNGSMSARKQNGVVSALLPKIGTTEIYDMLFSGLSSPSPGPGPAPSTLLARDKSVLDLVLEDATRLQNMLSGQDKARMELHFEEIRAVERSIASQMSGGGGGGSTVNCTKPSRPAPDTPPNSMDYGGWANETLRGQVQAELIAYAMACDLTRVVSWMITNDQTWLNSNKTSGSTTTPNHGGVPDIHGDSHSAPGVIKASNNNWHASLFAHLIRNLLSKSDAGGPLLNNTFMSLVSAEGQAAHGRTGFTQVVAGNGGKINLGQHIAANGQHPARVQISGLTSIGVPMNNTMGEVTGTIPGLLK